MRRMYWLFLILAIACSEPAVEQVVMPGVYVRYSEQQLDEDSFTRLYDTVEIAVQGHPRRRIFDVIRRYETLQIIDGKVMPAEHKVRRWTGTLEEKSQTIIVFGQARIISFYPETNSLKMGSTEYFRIKGKS